jgi:FMN phosphatase YigB (HAD superfamily)
METEAQYGERQPTEEHGLVFLLDVDNTLLDNDALKAEIGRRIEALVGPEPARRFWVLYEEVRQEQDFVDYPETLRRFIHEYGESAKPKRLREIFGTLPFSSFLYPGVLETLAHLRSLGTVVILSDGDQVFQPLKIRRSGLEKAVGGNVLIYVHKEHELPRVFDRYPADHYVVVDDKSRILSAMEEDSPSTFITVFVLQGHYAQEGVSEPAPDFVIHHISELSSFTKERFLQGRANRASAR